MNIKAKLFFKKEERILLKTNVNYERHTTSNGKPTTELLDGTISVSFEPQMYDDIFIESLLEHRLDKKKSNELNCYQKLYKPHDGKIVFYKDNDYEIELFQYNFKDAVIIELNEEFDSQTGMLVSMVISPAMQDYRFLENSTKWDQLSPTRYIKHSWEESWAPPREEVKVLTSNKPSLNGIRYSDKNGNEIPKNKLERGKIVYLKISTRNAVGKNITIDLDNIKLDFEYCGKPLEDDLLNVNISDDEMKVELKTIAQKK